MTKYKKCYNNAKYKEKMDIPKKVNRMTEY